MDAVIFNVQRYCLSDGSGIRTTVFFKGCPLHCLWCHNPESQSMGRQLMYYESKCTGCGKCLGLCDARERDPDRPQYIRRDPEKCTLCGKCVEACYQGANEICGRSESVEDIFSEVLLDRMFYGQDGGMTLSGGEPSMQPEASLALIRMAKDAGFGTVIETSGFGKREFFLAAADLGVVFYFDIKALDSDKHRKLTGVPNGEILANLDCLMKKGAPIVLRLPLIPGFNDSDDDLCALARFLKENEGRYLRAEIMKYHNLGFSKAKALARAYDAPADNATEQDADRWMRLLTSHGAKNIVFS